MIPRGPWVLNSPSVVSETVDGEATFFGSYGGWNHFLSRCSNWAR